MPGSKRRALKKLLSPNPTPDSPSDSSNSLDQTISPSPSIPPPAIPISQSHAAPPPPDAVVDSMASSTGLSREEIQEDLVLEQMASREKSIGHSHSPGLSTNINSTAVPPLQRAGGQSPSMYSDSPPAQPAGAMYASNGAGNGGKKKSSRQRFEERQARKQQELEASAPPSDPNWTAQLEKERQEEIDVISRACAVLGREIYEIAPDGHCMYSAIADQLGLLGIIPPHESTNPQYTRRKASEYMLSNPDDFMPFLPSITGEDSAGATDDGMITATQFNKYCQNVAETGEWGGEPEIQALSRTFKVPIHVIQRGPPTIVSHGGIDDQFGGAQTPEESAKAGDRVVRISYHKRMYGLGEHYNSLRVME